MILTSSHFPLMLKFTVCLWKNGFFPEPMTRLKCLSSSFNCFGVFFWGGVVLWGFFFFWGGGDSNEWILLARQKSGKSGLENKQCQELHKSLIWISEDCNVWKLGPPSLLHWRCLGRSVLWVWDLSPRNRRPRWGPPQPEPSLTLLLFG